MNSGDNSGATEDDTQWFVGLQWDEDWKWNTWNCYGYKWTTKLMVQQKDGL